MNSRWLLASLAVVALATAPAFADGDGKVKDTAKKIGKGIMWGPKKMASATKKGAQAMGHGAKKVIGKD